MPIDLIEWGTQIAEYIKDKLNIIEQLVVTPLEDLGHGHLTTNFALRHHDAGEMAATIAALFTTHPDVEACVAGKGFVNFTLKKHAILPGLRAMLIQGENYGRPNVHTKVSVDHTDVNPTGSVSYTHLTLPTKRIV